MDFLNQFGPAKYYILAIAGFCVVYYIVAFFFAKKRKAAAKDWLAENPDASKVYIQSKLNVIVESHLTVLSVDGDAPRTFTEGLKTGFYLKPGVHTVESTYETTRPGVVHKTVTDVYGPSKQEIEVEAGKRYDYGFDPKEKSYTFSEL